MKTFLATVGFLFLLGIVSASTATAQQQTANTASVSANDQQLLREIVAELKQLRSTIVRTNVNQARFQMAFEQHKSQQNRVDSMSRELEFMKNQMNVNPMRQDMAEMIKTSEERLLEMTDPRQRQNMERQIQSMKRNVEMQERREKSQKERQITLELQIPTEQAKLEQLNFEIERIKQEINALLNQ